MKKLSFRIHAMTYSLENTPKSAAANILLSSLLPLFSRLALTVSGSPTTAIHPPESVPGVTFLHDFIDSLELQSPATMVIAAARQLACLDPDRTLVLFSLLNQDKKMIMAGRKPSILIKNEILKLRKKQSAPNTPLPIMDATHNEIGLTMDRVETISVAAATDPCFESGQFILYSTSKPTPKEYQLLNYCLQHLKKRISEADINKASKKASELNLPYIILSLGRPLKKLNSLINAIKNLSAIEKLE